MKRKRKSSYRPSFNFLLGLFVILLVSLIFFMNYEKNCYDDMACLNNAISSCNSAKAVSEENNSTFKYRVLGKSNDLCRVEITLIKVSHSAEQEMKDMFEGKNMICEIPKETTLVGTTDVLDHCSGPLKESMYELIIQRMYNVVIKNLGETISELSEV